MSLEAEDFLFLTDAQKEQYMLMQRFFESEYWDFMRKWALANQAVAQDRMLHATSWDNNRIACGAHNAFQLLSNLEPTTDSEFAAYVAEAREAAEQREEEGNQD